ncbi:MAG: lysylphosphatidylglycerol synthase domain-containing protein [Acidimicrobiia bacterium]
MAGSISILVAIVGALLAVRSTASVPWGNVAIASGAAALATWSSACAWLFLVRDLQASPDPTRAYVAALPAKYIPGGFTQPVGLVLLTSRVKGTMPKVAAAGGVLLGISAIAGASFLPWTPRLALPLPAALGLLAVPFLCLAWWRPLVRAILRIGKPAWGEVDERVLPNRLRVLQAYALTLLSFVSLGSGFAMIFSAFGTGAPWGMLIAAFAVAWTVGFLAVPLPAGVGAREAMLVLLLSTWAAPGVVLAVTLLHRFATMLAELVLFVCLRSWRVVRNQAPQGGAENVARP